MPPPNPILPELPGQRSPLPSLPGLPGQERRPSRRRRRRPPETISDEERRSLLGRTLGGLAYVGGAVDKPFAAARGTVAALGSAIQGKPRQAKEDLKQLMHLIPFSGTFQEQLGEMGVDVPEEHIWGREVLERFGAPKNKPTGMAGWKNDPAEGFWDVAGIAADLLIAPPVMPGLLPVTAKGAASVSRGAKLIKEIDQLALAGKTEQAYAASAKLAKMTHELKPGRAGLEQLSGIGQFADDPLSKLPDRILGKTPAAKIVEVEAGERALLGLRPTWGPWSALLGDKPLATFGKGERAAAALDAVYYRGGLIPTLRSQFGATTKGVRTGKAQRAIEQEVAVQVHRMGALRGLGPHMAAEHAELAGIYTEKLAQYAQVAGDKIGQTKFRDFARYVTEAQSSVDDAARMTEQEITALFHVPAGSPLETVTQLNEFSRRMHKLSTDTMADVRDKLYEQILQYGGDGAVLRAAFVSHMPRRRVGSMTAEQERGLTGARRFDYSLRRLEGFDVPEGTYLLNQLVGEGTWSQPADASLSKLIQKTGKRTVGGLGRSQVVQLRTTAGLKETFEGFGRIVAFDGDMAVVSRMHPNGFMDQIRVPVSALDDATQISGSGLVPPSLYTAAEQKAAYQQILQDAGLTLTGKEKIADLRAQALFHGKLKPAFDRETTRGMKLPADPEKWPAWMDKTASADENMDRALERLRMRVEPLTKNGTQVAAGADGVADDLAAWLHGGPALPDGLFNRTIVDDHATYVSHGLDYLHGLMVKHNFLRGVVSTKQEAGYVPLSDAWGSVTTRFGKQKGTPRALTDDGLKTFMADYNAANQTKLTTGQLFVPEGTPKALQAFQDLGEPGSKVHSAFGQMFDAWTAAAKAGWTLPWPAFHVRNRTAGWFANASADVPWGIGHYIQSERSVGRWVLGKSNDFQYAAEIGPSGILKNTRVLDIGKEAAEGAGDVAGGGLRWIFGAPKTWDPTKFRGAREAFGMKPLARGEAQFAPVAVGERAYSYVETMNRVSLYDAARRHGYSMQQAAELVKRVQYDYSAVAPFEQDVMRRFVFPFYGWLKNNAIYHTGEIFGNPGGKVSTAIRMSATSNRFGAELPRWLSEQGAVPLGGPPEATSVIRQFGFPFEDVRNIQSTPGRTAQRGIAMMHPGISIPMKLFSGKDPYTGRDLKQMSGMTGIWQIDTLLQGLPTSRAYSTYRTATDKRKSAAAIGVDLLTGVKIGTYDMERSRLNDLERAIREEMDVNPYVWEGRHQYIPKHLKAQAGPEAPRKLRQVRALSKEREALKAKRELQAFGGVQETR